MAEPVAIQPSSVHRATRVGRRQAMAFGARSLALLILVGGAWLVIAGEAVSAARWPAPRWWWSGVWGAYIGALVLGVCAFVMLFSGATLARERHWMILRDAGLVPGALLRLRRRRIGTALGELVLPIGIMVGLWLLLASGAGLRPGGVLWAHAQALSTGLGLASVMLLAEERSGGRRPSLAVAVTGLALLVSSALWAPALLRHALSSQVYGPGLIVINPVLGAYSAAGQDILRSGLWYGLSPLGMSRFDYPSPVWCLLPGVLLTLAGLALPSLGRHGASKQRPSGVGGPSRDS